MDAHCEHLDGSYMGKCAICDDMVCGECFQTLFNTMICSGHSELEDESAWELIGFYLSPAAVEERRFFLTEQGVVSVIVETDEDTTEMYVPVDDREDAFEALSGASDDVYQCDTCKVFYAKELGTCPICGIRQIEKL